MIRERRGSRRAIVIALILVIALFSGAMLYPKVYEKMTGYTLFQPAVDTAHTDIKIPGSSLFSQRVLKQGARHIENDVSFMRGCAITHISYSGDGSYNGQSFEREQILNRYGSEAQFLMSYRCYSFNEQTSSMSPADTYVYLLTYNPQKSEDGTGWVTTEHGNG
ncbi:hypothetical protein [Bifidobacterium aquikefiricola]|uniref:Uncharacterized protein n=1 Tax=Bifidobacterium aquikefiricola TaxID=3059038 RepID=A0AB39U768_9BIFI